MKNSNVVLKFLRYIYYYMIPYMFEPYNAYQKPPKKKHWMEIAEEEALYHRMLMEAQKIEEAKHQQMTVQDSVQDGRTAAQTQTNVSPAAGAGGVPPHSYFLDKIEVGSFVVSPLSGAGPLSVSFVNNTRTPEVDQFLWELGDGTTSTEINPPTKVYQTGSYTIILHATSSAGAGSIASYELVVSAPVLTAGFTRTPVTSSAPFTASFTNTTAVTGDGAVTYRWLFGDGTTSTVINPTHVFNTGSYTIKLEATTSYNITSSATLMVSGTMP